MSGNRLVKQMAIAAGLLVMGMAPGLGRAQSSAPASPTYQDQSQAAPQQQSHKHGGEMANLNLTDDQKAQMKQIHESSKSQMAAVNNDSSLSADQKQAKIQQIHRGAHMQMVKLLTPEQRQQMKADARARRASRQQSQPEQSQPQAQPQSQQ